MLGGGLDEEPEPLRGEASPEPAVAAPLAPTDRTERLTPAELRLLAECSEEKLSVCLTEVFETSLM